MKREPSKRIYELIKANQLLLFVVLMPTANAAPALRVNGQPRVAEAVRQRNEKSIGVTDDVIVSFDIAAENIPTILISGRNQRAVRAEGAASGVEIRRRDATGTQDAATRVGITITDFSDSPTGHESRDPNKHTIEVSVPLGASVELNVRDTNVTIKDVAEANVRSVQGNIVIERASRSIEASNVTGDISLKDCRGRVRLSSVAGGIEATNIQAAEAGSSLRVNSVSGDVKLERVTYEQAEIETVSGAVTFNGILSSDAQLNAKTTSGNISLTLPADASFRVVASVSLGAFSTDFPLKLTNNAVRTSSLRLSGIHGSGGATIELGSHSGSIIIRRRK